MQLALLDLPCSLAGTPSLSFARPQALDPVDVLVWQPAAIDGVYAVEGMHLGRAVLGVVASQDLVRHSRFWRDEFRAFIGRGGTLVMLAPTRATLGIHTVQDVVAYDLIEALPDHAALRRTERTPAAVACAAGEPFHAFFDAVGPCFTAGAEFETPNAQAIATVAGTDRVCALYQYRHPGRLIVLPALAPSLAPAAMAGVVSAIGQMASRLRFEGATPSASADWKSPESPGESALRRRLAALAAERRAIEAEQERLARQLADMAFLRQLHGSDAAGAIDASALVLHSLGAYVQKGGAGTHTLMFELGGKTGVLVALDAAQAAPGAGLEDHVRRCMEDCSRELATAVVPVALHVAPHDDGPAQAQAAREVQRMRTVHPRLTVVTGSDLQQAYDTRDAARVERWLDAGDATRA